MKEVQVGSRCVFIPPGIVGGVALVFIAGRPGTAANKSPHSSEAGRGYRHFRFFSLFHAGSAVVVENRDTWFADDNGLTKELCADPQENEDEQPEINEPCCACDEAKYEVNF